MPRNVKMQEFMTGAGVSGEYPFAAVPRKADQKKPCRRGFLLHGGFWLCKFPEMEKAGSLA